MRDWLKFFDKITFLIMLTISIIGIILIYSASHTETNSYFLKQILWLIISLMAFFTVFRIRTDTLFRYGMFFYIFLLIILLLQLLAGRIVAGTKSWLKFGFFSVQVSEFVKIALAIVLSRYISKIEKIRWKEFFIIGAILGIPFLLIAIQPDMGTAIIFASLLITAIFLKGIKKSIIVFLIITIILSSFLIWNYFLKPYQKDRITSFLNPEKFSHSSGYQIIQSKIAIGAGGISGKGYLKGSQSKYKFLPTRHTDFIISLLGEEFGFLGISFFLLLYFIFFYRQFSFITESEEQMNLVYLLLGTIFFQFLINVLMSIGLIPILGLPLPFVSYGGSSMLGFFILEGIIFRIRINSYLNEF